VRIGNVWGGGKVLAKKGGCPKTFRAWGGNNPGKGRGDHPTNSGEMKWGVVLCGLGAPHSPSNCGKSGVLAVEAGWYRNPHGYFFGTEITRFRRFPRVGDGRKQVRKN